MGGEPDQGVLDNHEPVTEIERLGPNAEDLEFYIVLEPVTKKAPA